MLGIGLSIWNAALSGSGSLPALSIPFSSPLDSRVTFTRSTIGTYFDSAGLLQTAAIDAARFDYEPSSLALRGLLIEGARTNVVLWNRDLTNVAWVKVTVTAVKDQTGVDGSANSASKITATAGNGTVLQAITLASSARYQTAYIKRITGTGIINMTMDNGATWTAVAPTASWNRVVIPTQTLANPTFGFRIVTSGDAIAVDYVQNENGANKSSAIATTTVAVSRGEDKASMTGANFSDWYNPTEGTFVFEGDWYAPGISAGAIGVSDNTDGKSLWSYFDSAASGDFRLTVTDTAYQVVDVIGSGVAVDVNFGTAWAYKLNDFAGSVNGGTVVADAVGTVPTVDRLFIGALNGTSYFLFGHVKSLKYYNTRKSNAVLQALSIAAAKTVYADSAALNNGDSGLLSTRPKKTLAAAAALLSNGDTLSLKNGSRWFESLLPPAPTLNIGAYGGGAKPIIDGSRGIPAASWTVDPDNAGVWYADVTHELETTYSHFMMYQEGDAQTRRFTPYWDGVSIAANRLYVAGAAGRFTVHKQGSTNPDPQEVTETGTAYRYYVRPFDDTNPSLGVISVMYTEDRGLGQFRTHTNITGLTFQRTATKDMCGSQGPLFSQEMGHIEDCEFLEAPAHGFVSVMTIANSYALGRPAYGNGYSLGTAFHFFRDTLVLGKSAGVWAENCESDGFEIAYFSHGTGGGVNDHASVRVSDGVASNTNQCFNTGLTDTPWLIEDFEADNCQYLATSAGAELLMRGVTFTAGSGASAVALILWQPITLEDGTFTFPGASPCVMRKAVGAPANCVMNLTRLTNVGGAMSDGESDADVSFVDCVMGNLGPNYYVDSITATGTQLGFGAKTLAEIRTDHPGVDATCTLAP